MVVLANGIKRDLVDLGCQHFRMWEESSRKIKVKLMLRGENSSKKSTWLLKPILTIKRHGKHSSLYEVVLFVNIDIWSNSRKSKWLMMGNELSFKKQRGWGEVEDIPDKVDLGRNVS
ncbi:uncharacterized protein Bfra_003416 [Botrytis fragariae]|uniref:Uncharacterized protein n=1 Tax=Botrytis fragariae TaxID=1964551 RepID=A0A8H6AWP3_9HELO|nr:uncharacterized protein Bfra_003416 [Botrytis fragariae]KAF5874963.1 hypothetical protein Bfra_003416 [Botrytis fragariae]